ncbi:MAG: coniferyl-alcohol dehydrogenase [Deltaproteobacteria bacterium]|nr:coniferyl-alcohol dehydrogenase [Deltaproteobacteria bacterium]
MKLKDKVIVVTGASSGIGAETAKMLKERGVKVIGIDRNEPQGNVDQYIKADLGAPGSIEDAVRSTPDRIDALCNIAGVPPTFDREVVLRVNFLGLRHLTELMIEKFNNPASIVNMASLAGLGWPDAVPQIKKLIALRDFDAVEKFCEENNVSQKDGRAYPFSKEAVIVWTMMNRWTWSDRGIRMNCVSPGPVDTPILPEFVKSLGKKADEDKKIMDRPGRPEDIAPVVAFLCSHGSNWLRGTNIFCDGGMQQHILCEKYGYI